MTKASNENKFFHVGQKAFIWKDGKLLIFLSPSGHVDIPGGRIQYSDTDIETALKREVREETGYEITVGDPCLTWWVTLLDGTTVFLVGYECTYLSGEFTISSEHKEAVWVTADTYKNLLHDDRHYAALDRYFKKKQS